MDIQGYMLYLLEKRETLTANPGGVANELLTYFGETPATSTYQCHKRLNEYYRHAGKSIVYKNVHKRIKKLYSLGLIDKVKQNNNAGSNNEGIDNQKGKHGAIYYSLTPAGLFYILKNHLRASLTIILDHKKNSLFEFYLFPIIDIRTIEKLTDEHIERTIFDYLGNCCHTIDNLLSSLEQVNRHHGDSYNLGFTDTLVDSRYDSDPNLGSRQCIEYLKDKFKINWLEVRDTKIVEVRKNRIIKICSGKNELVLRIHPEKNKAILSEGKRRISEFVIQDKGGGSYFIMDFIPMTTKDYLERRFNNKNFHFHGEMEDHRFRLCSDLMTYICHDYFISDEEKIVKQTDSINLAKDTKFLNLVQEFKDEYDSYCNYISNLNEYDYTTM